MIILAMHMIIWVLILLYIIFSVKRMFRKGQTETYLQIKRPQWYTIGVCLLFFISLCAAGYIVFIVLNQIFHWSSSDLMTRLYYQLMWTEACLYLALRCLLTLAGRTAIGKEGISSGGNVVLWKDIFQFEQKGKSRTDVLYKIGENSRGIMKIYHDEAQRLKIAALLVQYAAVEKGVENIE